MSYAFGSTSGSGSGGGSPRVHYSGEAEVSLRQLPREDLQLLLAKRGMPTVGSGQQLAQRLCSAVKRDLAAEWRFDTDIPDLPEGRHCASLVEHDGVLYLFGGTLPDGAATSSMLQFAPGADSEWRPVEVRAGATPLAVQNQVAVVAQGCMWVFLGYGGPETGYQNTDFCLMQCFCFESRTWELLDVHIRGDSLPESFWWDPPRAVFADDRYILLFSSESGGLYRFCISRLEWDFCGHLSQARERTEAPLMATFCAGDGLYIMGWDAVTNDALMWHVPMERLLPPEGPGHAEAEADAAAAAEPCGCGGGVEVEARLLPFRGQPPGNNENEVFYVSELCGSRWVLQGFDDTLRHGLSSTPHAMYVFDSHCHEWATLCFAEGTMPIARDSPAVCCTGPSLIQAGGLDHNGQYLTSCQRLTLSPGVLSPGHGHEASSVVSQCRLLGVAGPGDDMLGLQEYSDAVLLVAGREIKVHRVVLARHSRVLAAMWGGEMKEAGEVKVVIRDVSYPVMLSLCHYLYGSLTRIHPDQVVELFQAADRFEVQGLMRECLQLLKENVDCSNAASLVLVADVHGSRELYESCVEVGSASMPEVTISESFSHLMVGKPQLAQKFVHAMSSALQRANQQLSQELQQRSSAPAANASGCFMGEALRLHNAFAAKPRQPGAPARRGDAPLEAQLDPPQQLPAWVSEAIRNSFRRSAAEDAHDPQHLA